MDKPRLLSRLGNIDINHKLPLVEITGCGRVLIENHNGVMTYSQKEITVRVSFGCLRVTGLNMLLAEMHRDQLVISGQIDGVFFIRR